MDAAKYDFNGDSKITAITGEGPLTVNASGTIDLNGIAIAQTGNAALDLTGNHWVILMDGAGDGHVEATGTEVVRVRNLCELVLEDGTITGGVTAVGLFDGGTLSMYGGTITGNNNPNGNGGGVYVNDGFLYLIRGAITGNSAKAGGSVYLMSGQIDLSSAPNVRGNDGGNVYLTEGTGFHISDTLGESASIGVTTEVKSTGSESVQFTMNLKGNGNMYRCFVSDEGYGLALTDTEDAALVMNLPTYGTPDFTLPGGAVTVAANAFEGIAASIVDVPAGCRFIGEEAFRNCANLKQIRVPAGCAIGRDAFAGCGNVYVFGANGSYAEIYCANHGNCIFVPVE